MLLKHLKYIVIVLIFFVTQSNLNAQDDCVLKLNEAEKLYENGKIEQIPSLVNPCIESGFNRENRIQALRLLTLVYIFEDNTPMAEKTILNLLKIDPEYSVNQAIDPVEYIRLFNSFNTAPIFSLGLIGGLNATTPILNETYSLNSLDKANPKYTPAGLSLSIGINGTYHIAPKWDVSFEPSFSHFTFQMVENVSTNITTTINETMNYINLPAFGSYNFYRLNQYEFYTEVGVSYNILLSGTISGTVTFNNNENPDFEPPKIETREMRNDYYLNASIGAGTKIDLNRSNLQLSLRYNIGLMNVVNPDSRSFEDYSGLTSDYMDVDNDFSINNICFMIGFNREFYLHKKKPNNQTNYDVIK